MLESISIRRVHETKTSLASEYKQSNPFYGGHDNEITEHK